MTDRLAPGSLVRWLNGQAGGYGVVAEVGSDGRRVTVQLDAGERLSFAWPVESLEHVVFEPGAIVEMAGGTQTGVVVQVAAADGLRLYHVAVPSGSTKVVPEGGLRPGTLNDPVAKLRSGQVDSARSVDLRVTATRMTFAHQFDPLSSLSNSRVEIKPHQIGVVHRVSSNYPHRFLLADEVGLGKTIEAGLIIKELKSRGIANRVLVLAPSGIVTQWQYEMASKFNESFARYTKETIAYLSQRHPGENVWTLNDNVIASTTYAAWTPQRASDIILAGWDMVVIDEAHHARRTWQGEARYSSTKLYDLAMGLADPERASATAMLLLTATPMQLHRFELFSLVELLDPTLFADFGDFDRHADELASLNRAAKVLTEWTKAKLEDRTAIADLVGEWTGQDPVAVARRLDSVIGRDDIIRDLERRHRLSDLLIRNRKSVVGGFMPRVAAVWEVEMTDVEWRAYEAATEYVRTGFQRSKANRNNALGFLMAVFQKLNASSSYALRQSLKGRAERLEAGLRSAASGTVEDDDLSERPLDEALGDYLAVAANASVREEIKDLRELIALLDAIPLDSKMQVLIDRLEEIRRREPDAKVLVFTQFRATQEYIVDHLPPTWDVHMFHGQLDTAAKDAAVERIREGSGPQLLVSTEAGGEGRNFQFAHILINYDLPWNPMRIEQRIGRLDRIGQRHPVTIVNFSIVGTIEERVLEVLTRRIRVFEETIGGLDPILGDVESDLRNVFMAAEQERIRALESLDRQLETRVAAARRMEQQLGDLIMDTKSFRQDEVRELLDRPPTVDHDTLRRHAITALRDLRGRAEPMPELEGAYEFRLHGGFENEFPSVAQRGIVRRGTFVPAVALEHEQLEFFAFGHDVIDRLIERTQSKEFGGRATARRVSVDDISEPRRGWHFVHALEFEGFRPFRELLGTFVDSVGQVDDHLGTWLLERAGRFEPDPPAPEENATGDAFDRAVEIAGVLAMRRLMERQVALSAENRLQVDEERARLERYYTYRSRAAKEKLAAVRRTFERVSSSLDPQVLRIVPVWAKNLETAEGMVGAVEAERERRIAALVGREQVAAQHELLALSYVELVPAGSAALASRGGRSLDG